MNIYIYDTYMICTHLYSLHPSGLHQLQVQDARGIKGFHLRSCDSWGLGKVFLCNVESEIRGAKMWNIMNALKHIETMLFWEATTTAIIRYVWNVLWKSLKNWTAVTCGKLQKKQCLDDFLLTPVTRWTCHPNCSTPTPSLRQDVWNICSHCAATSEMLASSCG
jgi:hypothetical protein